MTKENMKKLFQKRYKHIQELKKIEEQKVEEQKKRMFSLVENMKKDLELKKLIHEEKLTNTIRHFYAHCREDGFGFGMDVDRDLFVQPWGTSENDKRHMGFSPYLVNENCVELNTYFENMYTKELTIYKNCNRELITSDLLKRFCDSYEKFHEDFHNFLDSTDWENVELD